MNRALLLTAAGLALLPAAIRAQAAAPDSAPAPSVRVASAAAPGAPVLARATYRPLAAGDVVRLLSSAGRYSGTLTQVTADTLTLAAPGRRDAVVRADVTEMHRLVARGSRGGAIMRGAGLGLVAGAVLGFIGGSAAGDGDCEHCAPGKDATAQAAFAADGAVLGALFGAMLGPTFRRTRWERVDAAPVPPLQAPAAAAESAGPPPQR
ncbi:MAG TPA: hypothetical protein VFJ82_08725 [Longimicrobium sp.]|nr:hypothetical protein [Longimicrobium sp.]